MTIAIAVALGFLTCGTFISAEANWRRMGVRERVATCISIGAGVLALFAFAVR